MKGISASKKTSDYSNKLASFKRSCFAFSCSNKFSGDIFGNNVGISHHCFIQVRGKVKIGSNVIIGPHVNEIPNTEHVRLSVG